METKDPLSWPDEIEIVVTPEQANELGVSYSRAWDCPIARSLRRRFGLGPFSVAVGPFSFQLGLDPEDRYQRTYTFDKSFTINEFEKCKAGETFRTTAKLFRSTYTDSLRL